MVKNSFDAAATTVHIYFGDDSITIADNGSGMSYEDLTSKWLFVAYSAKRGEHDSRDYRRAAEERGYYAGSKGIGRFSSDRLGQELVLQTRSKEHRGEGVHRLLIDWTRFEKDDKQRFERVPVTYSKASSLELPNELADFRRELKHGTIIEVRKLREPWDRAALQSLKASLAKLINPFGAKSDGFSIVITAPAQRKRDRELSDEAKKSGEELAARDIINGPVGNFIFSELQGKTTFIDVTIEGGQLLTSLTDRGELIYRVREPNPYPYLDRSGFRCEMYYLNLSAKSTFTRRVGVQPIKFGSVFLFRNNFRVYPIGEEFDDWFGFNRRKQQGYARFLGSRDVIGRIDVFGADSEFQEASSRNQGLIDTPAVRQLQKCVMDHCFKRLEKYVVPVSWADKTDAHSEDISQLLTDPGRARVSAAVANLVDNDDVELLDYSKRLVGLLNERSSEFESSLVSLRSIADKTRDKALLANITNAEKRFDELKRSEAEARKIADQERAAAEAANARAQAAEGAIAAVRFEAETERRRAHFLQAVVNLDTATILNLHHQVTIYAVDIGQQIENFLADTAGQEMIPRAKVLGALEHMAFLNRKVLAVTRFASKANFKLDSEKIETDLPAFIADYIDNIAKASGSARVRIEVENTHPGLEMRFNPIDISIVVDNLVSNARRAKATLVNFTIFGSEREGLSMRVQDNGRGIASGVDRTRIFEMGYTSTGGSGLGLYHVRQVLGELGGSIELEPDPPGGGASFLVRISPRRNKT